MYQHNTNKDKAAFRWRDMIKSLFFLLGDKRKRYIGHTSLLILVLFYDVVPALIVGKIVDFFTEYAPGMKLMPFYGYAVILGVTYSIIALIRLSTKKNLNVVQSEVNYDTRVKGFEKLLDFSVKWHDSENTGNKVQKIQSGTDALKDLQRILSNEFFPQFIQMLGIMTVLLFMEPWFFIYCAVYISIFVCTHLNFSKRLTEISEENNVVLEQASGTYYEGLSNVLTIKTLGVKADFKKSVNSREELSRDFNIKRLVLMNNKWKSFQVINGLAMGGVMLLAGYMFISGSITLGLIFVIYTYFQKLHGSMGESTIIFDKLIQNKISIGRMMPIFLETEAAEGGDREFPRVWDAINFHEATFAYAGSQKTGEEKIDMPGLSTLSVSIRRNEKVGVVGLSGSGKSTFAKVLLGLYKITSGEYKIGKTNFGEIIHDDVTKKMALVLQDSEMFNLPLRDNITLMRKLDENLLNQAIDIAQLKDLIEKLPVGLDTMIGEKGYRLSGGERQRIGIARALYKDPEILVLDEATSSLDSKTETLILRALEVRLTKKTVISIAHRISTLKNTDRVIVFDSGTVVEEGTYNQLSKDATSKFYEISQTQK